MKAQAFATSAWYAAVVNPATPPPPRARCRIKCARGMPCAAASAFRRARSALVTFSLISGIKCAQVRCRLAPWCRPTRWTRLDEVGGLAATEVWPLRPTSQPKWIKEGRRGEERVQVTLKRLDGRSDVGRMPNPVAPTVWRVQPDLRLCEVPTTPSRRLSLWDVSKILENRSHLHLVSARLTFGGFLDCIIQKLLSC